MNLSSKVVRQIERGAKTEHRIPVRGKKPTIGDSLIVQPRVDDEDEKRRKPQVRVRVLNVALEQVGDITPAGAQAEGHASLTEFASDWMSRYDAGWPPTTEALCPECHGHKHYIDGHGDKVECTYCDPVGTIEVPDTDRLADTEFVIARFQRKHAHHLVYVLAVAPDVDIVHYLNQRAYLPPTTNPSEALDREAPLLGDPRPDWRQRAETRRVEALRARDGARLAGLRTEEERLAELKRLAAEHNVDIDSDVKVIRHRLNAIETKITNKTQRAA